MTEGSGANGHATVACRQVRPQVCGVGSNGIAPIALSVWLATSLRISPVISLRVLGSTLGTIITDLLCAMAKS